MNNDLISRKALIKWIDDSVSQYGHTYSTDMFNMWGLFKDYLINNAPTVVIDWEKSDAYLDCIKRIKSLEKENDELRQFLKANFERPQGEWIKDNSGNRFCSECGNSALYHEIGLKFESRFCPNCGAKMKGGIDNAPTVAINKDFYKIDKSNPINRSDLFQ